MNSSKALMPARLVLALAAAVLLGVLALASPVAAHASAEPAGWATASATSMSSGRLGAIVAAGLGLVGVVIGGLALGRPAGLFGTRSGRLGVIVALAAGLVGVVLGGLVIATSEGGLGTGNGLGGAFVALLLGLVAVALGGLALAGPRRAD